MNKQSKKDFIMFFIILLITMIIFIPFLKSHFSTDSYCIANIGYKDYAINCSLKDGRVFMALIGCIAEIFNIHINSYIVILTILALVLSCITIIVLKNIILSYKKTDKLLVEILLTFICYFTIFNFMYIENLFFVECLVMSCSVLFYLLAAKTLVSKNNFYLIKTFILVILGILCYQGTISMYLISVLVFSLLKNENYKQVIIDVIISGMILILGVLVQLSIIKCVEKIFEINAVRVNGIKNITSNIILSIKNLPNIIINTGFVYNKYLYITFIFILEIFIMIKAYKDKLSNKLLLNQFLIIVFSILFGMAVSLISTSGFWSARIRYSIGTTIGFLFIYLYCKTNLIDTIKPINTLIITTFCIYSISIIVNYIAIMNNSLRVNYKDKEFALEIINYVENYEQENNIKVDNLVVLKGQFESKAFYKDLRYYGSVLSWSAIRTQWSVEGLLEMYSDRDFNWIEPEEKAKYYLNNVDKNKEYMCIDNTLYVSYYIN